MWGWGAGAWPCCNTRTCAWMKSQHGRIFLFSMNCVNRFIIFYLFVTMACAYNLMGVILCEPSGSGFSRSVSLWSVECCGRCLSQQQSEGWWMSDRYLASHLPVCLTSNLTLSHCSYEKKEINYTLLHRPMCIYGAVKTSNVCSLICSRTAERLDKELFVAYPHTTHPGTQALGRIPLQTFAWRQGN